MSNCVSPSLCGGYATPDFQVKILKNIDKKLQTSSNAKNAWTSSVLLRRTIKGRFNMIPSHEELSAFALQLAEVSALAIAPHFRNLSSVAAKAAPDWDPVTEGDRAAERAMRQLIEATYPEHGINGEEYGIKPSKCQYSWVLDPIDGTRAFVIGMPTWATLIGLYENDRPLIGVMNQPFVGEAFLGEPGAAWNIKNGQRQRLAVRPDRALTEARAGTTSPDRSGDIPGFGRLRKAVQLMRYGGDAYFFSLVAAGQLDIALDPGLQPYDIAALIPIIEGAGGVVREWTGGNPAQGGNIIAASCAEMAEKAIAELLS
jgi:myo-inositol-1(or 4)-monophosphatase